VNISLEDIRRVDYAIKTPTIALNRTLCWYKEQGHLPTQK